MRLSVIDDPAVTTVLLARSDKRNAFDQAMFDALADVGARLAASPPRVVVIGAEGPHFSSGLDLRPDNPLAQRLLPAIANRDEAGIRALIGDLRSALWALGRLPCPVIAAVEGMCTGAGLELVLTADLVVAAEDARFSLPEARFGFVADLGGTVRLARRVGASRAAGIILTCREVGGVEAQRIGLVDELVAPTAALGAAQDLARRIASGSAPAATNAMLAVLRDAGASDALDAEREAGVRALMTGEVVRGLQSFITKAPLDWTTS
jgi:enoyl-CoA hydratase/carnithine racemase